MHICSSVQYRSVQRKPPPPPSGEQRKSVCDIHVHVLYIHTCTIETFLFIFHLDRFQCHNLDWNRLLKIAHATCTRFGPPKAPASLLVTTHKRHIWGTKTFLDAHVGYYVQLI